MKKLSLKNVLLALFAMLVGVGCNAPDVTSVGKRVAALDDSAWRQSEWISVADAPVITGVIRDGSRAADGANWFVTTVTNDKKVKEAKWMTCGLGVYDLYVNGKLVGDEVLKPGFTHNGKTKRSFTYDITDAIARGVGRENIFSAQVTPGWWGDKVVTPSGHDGMIGRKCAFRGVLELTYADGTKQLLGTDTEHWLAGIAGPVKHAAIFDGEDYDARERPGYDCPDKLSTPEVNTEFTGEILPSSGAEVYMRTDLALTPVKAYVWHGVTDNTDEEYGKISILREYASGEIMTVRPEETLVVDFGQNCAGVPSFVFKAKEGTTVNCLPAELLNDGNGAKSRGMDGPEGSCHRTNLRIPQTGMILNYTFADDAGQFVSYCPRRTFFGYRYVSITATDEVTIRSIQSIPVTSIAKNLETGSIITGSDDINKLISNTIWGQRSNYLSVPTDCPQRNERLGWTADTQVFTETGTFFANTRNFFHKWMRDMMDSQSELGGFPGVAPTSQYGDEMMRLGWADAGVIVPWTIWKQFGDEQIVDETWASMEKYMTWVNDTKFNHQAHIAENGNYQWADWLSYEPLESCSGRSHGNDKDGRWAPLPETVDYWNYLSASYWAIDAGMMRDMAAATGRDAEKYERMASEAKAYIKETFLNEDGTFKTEILNTMQTPALFALKNGVVEGDAKEALLARLRQNFAEHDGCLQTGFLGTSILMTTLTENGMSDIAWNLLFQRKNPSWLYSIDNGATTIWERWNSYTIEKGMGPAGMNSFNHYAYGSVCQWIWETVAGIAADVRAPGFKRIVMRPVPDKRLGWVKAEFKSAAGLIKSEWKYEGDVWTWTFTVPEGATAAVTLPGETEEKEYQPGTHTVTK